MMKKIFCLTIALGLCLVFGAMAEGTAEAAAKAAVTAAELSAWAQEVRAVAAGSVPLNDPTDPEDAESEDGNLFAYSFAFLYSEDTELTESSELLSIDLVDDGPAAFRGIAMGTAAADLVAEFPSDNPDMAGDREGALLYLRESADQGLLYGTVRRDGQRISTVEYGEIAPAEGGFHRTALICFFHEGLLYKMRAEGLSAKANLDEAGRDELVAALRELDGKDEYLAVASGAAGTDIAPFSEADLVFSGIDFLHMLPEDLPGTPESALLDSEDGIRLLIVSEEAYEAVFYTDDQGGQPLIASLTILDDRMEGPRGVRLGDYFHEDLRRFRNEGNGMDGSKEYLYGSEDTLPRGVVEFEDEGITLRYLTEVSGGRVAELLLRYRLNELDEIILHMD